MSPRARVAADEQGLLLGRGGRRRRVPWNTLTGGGLAHVRTVELEAMGPDAPRLLPGLAELVSASRTVTQEQRLLVLAHGRGARRPRLLLVPVRLGDPDDEDLVAEIRRRLGPLWHGDEPELGELKRRLGARSPLWYVPVGLVFVLAVAAILLPAIAAWGQLTAQDGGLGELEPWWLAALAAWLGLLAVLLRLARREAGTERRRFAAALVAFAVALGAPGALATYRLAADGRVGELAPASVAALLAWLGLVLLLVRLARRRYG